MFTRLRRDLGTYDIWTTDLTRPAETPMTSGPGMETGEVWLPNGRGMAFSAAQGTVPNLHYKDFTTGSDRRLLSSPRFQFPTDASRDSTNVFYQQRTDLGNWDVLSVSLADPGRVTPVLASPFSEHSFKVSPAGTHAAFVSDESGQSQVYVTPLPPTGQKTMVSTSGGARPKWRKGSRELYFLSGGRLMVVAIDAAGTAGTARPVFDARDWLDFDVARDGRFIANIAVVVARQQPLSVIVNWAGPDGR
jgi:Tol biopolymer transport system component